MDHARASTSDAAPRHLGVAPLAGRSTGSLHAPAANRDLIVGNTATQAVAQLFEPSRPRIETVPELVGDAVPHGSSRRRRGALLALPADGQHPQTARKRYRCGQREAILIWFSSKRNAAALSPFFRWRRCGTRLRRYCSERLHRGAAYGARAAMVLSSVLSKAGCKPFGKCLVSVRRPA